jgi:hypothetical protein
MLTVHLCQSLSKERGYRTGRAQRLDSLPGIRFESANFLEQILGVDEAAASLPKVLRRFLLAKPEHINTLLADATGEAGEVAVGRDNAEAVEPSAVQKVHGVDHEGNVRPVLASRVGELLLGDNGVFGQNVGPWLQAWTREITIDSADTGLSDLGDLLKETTGDTWGGIVGIDQDGKTGRVGGGIDGLLGGFQR